MAVVAFSPYLLVISAALLVLSENRPKAVAAAATTPKTSPIGFAFVAMLRSSIASLADVILFVRERKAETSPHIAAIL